MKNRTPPHDRPVGAPHLHQNKITSSWNNLLIPHIHPQPRPNIEANPSPIVLPPRSQAKSPPLLSSSMIRSSPSTTVCLQQAYHPHTGSGPSEPLPTNNPLLWSRNSTLGLFDASLPPSHPIHLTEEIPVGGPARIPPRRPPIRYSQPRRSAESILAPLRHLENRTRIVKHILSSPKHQIFDERWESSPEAATEDTLTMNTSERAHPAYRRELFSACFAVLLTNKQKGTTASVTGVSQTRLQPDLNPQN